MLHSVCNFPVEALLGITCFALYCVATSFRPDEAVIGMDGVLALSPLFYVLTYCCNRLCTGRFRCIYYLSYVFFVPFLFVNLSLFLSSWGYGFTLLFSFFLLLIVCGRKENALFARDTLTTVVNLFISFVVGYILYFTVLAIYSSVVYIFGLSNHFDFWEYWFMMVQFVFIPLLFCISQQVFGRTSREVSGFVKVVLNFILSPAVIIYTAILYVYFIRIAFLWELPKGGIAYMVLAFVIVSLAGRMSQLVLERRYYDWFYNRFSYISLLPLTIFWIGTVERICTYGFTDSRVYLLMAGVLMTLYMVFLLFRQLSEYRLMLIISSVGIAAFTFVPGISARSIGISSQLHRLQDYARQLGIWDETSNKLLPTAKTEETPENASLRREFIGAYDYLSSAWGKEKMVSRIGRNYVEYNDVDSDTVVVSTFIHRNALPIDVTGYSRYYSLTNKCCRTQYEGGRCSVYLINADSLIFEFDMQAHFSPYREMLLRCAQFGETPDDVAPFVVVADSSMLIIDGITVYSEYDSIPYRIEAESLFRK